MKKNITIYGINFSSNIYIILFLFLTGFFIPIQPLLSQSNPYSQSGGTVTKSNQTYTSSTLDVSGVLVTNSGVFNLLNSTITTTGNSSSTDNSSKYGLNAAVLTNTSGKVTLTDCTISTTGSGANGLFATGSGSIITMTNGTITATGGNAHGVDVTYTGTIILTNVSITTSGQSSSVIATDFGGGTVTVTGGTFTASASKSAGIYSTGLITVSDAVVTANGDNGAVIDADGIIILNNTKLTGSKNGLMIHNTVGQMSLKGVFTINGGSITGKGGDAFYINGAKATVTAKGAAGISASTGNIANVVSSGNLTFIADGENITGNIITDNTGTASVTLQNNSLLTGYIKSASLNLDAGSSWILTANSYVTGFSNTGGISGLTITNITGNGFNIYYDATLAANSALGGKTYSLINGGTLTPKTANSVTRDQTSIPSFWSIEQNYPNPFNPSTVISFSVPKPGKVIIKIYDIIGKEITTLINDQLSAGYYKCNWNANSLSGGTYFYRLVAFSSDGDQKPLFSRTKKLILIK